MRDSLGLVSLALVGLLAACTPSSRSTEPGDSAATSSTAATSSPASSTQPASPAASLAPVQPSAAPPTEPSPAPAPDKRRRYRVAALGDSITDERVGGGGYLRYLRRTCPRSTFLDFGKGGDMTNQMRRRFDADIAPLARAGELTTLLVYGGVNDLYSDQTAGRSNERIEADLSAIYASARALGLTVVGVTVSPWGGFTRYFTPHRSENTRLLNAWILGQQGGPLERAVDSYAPLSCGDPERLCPEYERPRPDGLHPGPAGHEVLGRALAEQAFADCE